MLSRLLLGDGNVESTSSKGGGLRGFVKEGESLVYFQGVGVSFVFTVPIDRNSE